MSLHCPTPNPPPMALNRQIEGKRGALYLGFELDERGRTILRTLDRRAPMVVQQALYWDEQMPQMACIYTLSSGGPLVDGDRYRREVHLAQGCEVHLASGAATRIASMVYDRVEVENLVVLHEGAYLEWLPEPTIPSAHSRCHTTTELVVAPSAALFWGEVMCCGRLHHGERFDFDSLSQHTLLRRPDGEVLARDVAEIVPSQEHPSTCGILGTFTHWATIFVAAPAEQTKILANLYGAHFAPESAMGVALLMGDCGIVVRLLGHSAEELQRSIRHLCSEFRRVVKGARLDADFPWR